MTTQDPELLQALLSRKERELRLVMEIDDIRDSIDEPAAMLGAIVNVIADALDTDLCMIALVEKSSGALAFKAVNDRREWLQSLDMNNVQGLVEEAFVQHDVKTWTGEEARAAFSDDDAPELHLAVVPITMGPTERLGALVVARRETPFGEEEAVLLRAAESQLDSAIIQGYVFRELGQRNSELETIYRIDGIRDRDLTFDEMLSAVLDELRRVIDAEMGFIMLYDYRGERLELRAVTHEDLFESSYYQKAIQQLSDDALQKAELIQRDGVSKAMFSAMCIPLILHEEILGVLGVANGQRRGRFNERERRLLTAVASQMDTAIFETLERVRLKRVLGRSVGPRVMERLLANPSVEFLEGERKVLTVLYADIRDSMGLAAETEAELLVAFINDYLGQMAEIVLNRDGTLDKYVGDEVMALFGAPFPQDDHALRAVKVGLEMQARHAQVIEKWKAKGVRGRPIGIGIATGEMIVGEMGSVHRTDYTVIGNAANLGARICSAAGAGEVLVSDATYQQVREAVNAAAVTGLKLKGVTDDTTVYRVSGLHS